MHKTRIELEKWFKASRLVLKHQQQISIRYLAECLDINRSSAELLMKRLTSAEGEQLELLKKMAEVAPETQIAARQQKNRTQKSSRLSAPRQAKKASPEAVPETPATPPTVSPGKVWVRYSQY
ncbi:hypothetical protein ACQ4M3_07600 [Leptolyngbya sp. AN03gr2]|uniref:hypothetical protein n=1 Tax=unclassified Leptolyngbya TaxID=2650499 RepID=UPI003D315717